LSQPAAGVRRRPAQRVDFAIAACHESLCARLVDTRADGRLTTERILAAAGGDPRGMSVGMCGARWMVRA